MGFYQQEFRWITNRNDGYNISQIWVTHQEDLAGEKLFNKQKRGNLTNKRMWKKANKTRISIKEKTELWSMERVNGQH